MLPIHISHDKNTFKNLKNNKSCKQRVTTVYAYERIFLLSHGFNRLNVNRYRAVALKFQGEVSHGILVTSGHKTLLREEVSRISEN